MGERAQIGGGEEAQEQPKETQVGDAGKEPWTQQVRLQSLKRWRDGGCSHGSIHSSVDPGNLHLAGGGRF